VPSGKADGADRAVFPNREAKRMIERYPKKWVSLTRIAELLNKPAGFACNPTQQESGLLHSSKDC
jgi:hypothetical protein